MAKKPVKKQIKKKKDKPGFSIFGVLRKVRKDRRKTKDAIKKAGG